MPVAAAAAAAGQAPLMLAARLPGFPWDRLAPAAATAAAYPDGIADLSIGSPVDPVPAVVRGALAPAPNSPRHPPTEGTPAPRTPGAPWAAGPHRRTGSPPHAP